MFRIRDPRSMFKFTAVYSYIMAGIDILDIINYARLGNIPYLVASCITGGVALIAGFVFFAFSCMDLVKLIKYKKFLWIPACILFFSDILCALFAIFAIVRFDGFVKILNHRQHERGGEQVYGGSGRTVVNVDCTVLDGKDKEQEFNEKLDKLNKLKESNSIDEEEYKNLKNKLISDYIN